MKSFRMEKTGGDKDVTWEALVWLAVLVFIAIPLILFFIGSPF